VVASSRSPQFLLVGRVTPLSRMLLGGCLMTFPKIYTSFTHQDEIALDGLGISSSFPQQTTPMALRTCTGL
jgi:hypothetical protein